MTTISIKPVSQLLSRPWSIPNDNLKCACAPCPVTLEVGAVFLAQKSANINASGPLAHQLPVGGDEELLNYQCKWTMTHLQSVKVDLFSFWSPLGLALNYCNRTYQLLRQIDLGLFKDQVKWIYGPLQSWLGLASVLVTGPVS